MIPLSKFFFKLTIEDDLEVDETELVRVTEKFLRPHFIKKVSNFKEIILSQNHSDRRRLSYETSVYISGTIYFNNRATKDADGLSEFVAKCFNSFMDEFLTFLGESDDETLRSISNLATIGFSPKDDIVDSSEEYEEVEERGTGSKYIIAVLACILTLVGVTVSLAVRRHKQKGFERKLESILLSNKKFNEEGLEDLCIEIDNDDEERQEKYNSISSGEYEPTTIEIEPQPIRIAR